MKQSIDFRTHRREFRIVHPYGYEGEGRRFRTSTRNWAKLSETEPNATTTVSCYVASRCWQQPSTHGVPNLALLRLSCSPSLLPSFCFFLLFAAFISMCNCAPFCSGTPSLPKKCEGRKGIVHFNLVKALCIDFRFMKVR